MRLVIFGLTISSSWANGHATIWRGLCSALARQGHQVTFFEHDVSYYASHRDLGNPTEYSLILYESWASVASQAREALKNSDVGIVTSYCPDAMTACDLVLASSKTSVFYDLDSPVTLERLARNQAVEYIPPDGLQPFDLVLSYAGGRVLKEMKDRLGAKRVEPLYGSADPNVHRPVKASVAYQADMSYLGTYSMDRQPALQELLLEPARRTPERRFLLGGAQYPDDFPWAENIWFVQHVPPPKHSAFYCSSKITLNVTRGPMATSGFCPSGRLFEAAACETPVLSDSWEGLSEFFEPDQEILVASHASDVVSALDRDGEELRSIGIAARERVMDEHTADHRSRELVTLLEASA